MEPARYTQDDLIKLQFALPAEEWVIQIVHETGDHHPIRDIVPRRKLFNMNQVSWFRARNRDGCHVYGRPNNTRFILIDDVSPDGLIRMRRDGLPPTAVIETSPSNFQVWITAADDELPIPVASELARLLATDYGGDPGSTDAFHLGRLPGLRNKKSKYRTCPGDGGPLVKLITARMTPIIPDAIRPMLAHARILTEQRSPSSPSALGACAPINLCADIDPARSPMTQPEAIVIYAAELERQAERKGSTMPTMKEDRSGADFQIVRGLYLEYGYDPDDLAALLAYASDKSAERGMDYVLRTVNRAYRRPPNEIGRTVNRLHDF